MKIARSAKPIRMNWPGVAIAAGCLAISQMKAATPAPPTANAVARVLRPVAKNGCQVTARMSSAGINAARVASAMVGKNSYSARPPESDAAIASTNSYDKATPANIAMPIGTTASLRT